MNTTEIGESIMDLLKANGELRGQMNLNRIAIGKLLLKGRMKKLLTKIDYEVLKHRYIKLGTLEEVGKEFNVTRERIRQIEANALKKLGYEFPEQNTPVARNYIK